MKRYLITGAKGEIGHALLDHLTEDSQVEVLALDKQDPIESSNSQIIPIKADITDLSALEAIFAKYQIDCIFHLAAILSSSAEKNPILAHQVNVQGSVNLIELAIKQAKQKNKSVRFVFPSSIAAYGVAAGASRANLKEDQHLTPNIIYGINKLYVENLGHYFSRVESCFEFATVRFPGLISAFSLPTGGTSDFASHMIHAAVKGEPYSCYVSPDLQLPYMVMPDAVNALLSLSTAPRASIVGQSFNVTSFSLGPAKTLQILQKSYPNFKVSYQVEQWREEIIKGWPESLDDSLAQERWGWEPEYNLDKAFAQYLIPNITMLYSEEKKCIQA